MSYTFDEYERRALRTANLGEPLDKTLRNTGLGIAGEAIEVIEAVAGPMFPLMLALSMGFHAKTISEHVKKVLDHGYKLDPELLKKELGDELWYMNRLCVMLGTSLGEVARLNNEKLEKRYPTGKVNAADSQAKADETPILLKDAVEGK